MNNSLNRNKQTSNKTINNARPKIQTAQLETSNSAHKYTNKHVRIRMVTNRKSSAVIGRLQRTIVHNLLLVRSQHDAALVLIVVWIHHMSAVLPACPDGLLHEKDAIMICLGAGLYEFDVQTGCKLATLFGTHFSVLQIALHCHQVTAQCKTTQQHSVSTRQSPSLHNTHIRDGEQQQQQGLQGLQVEYFTLVFLFHMLSGFSGPTPTPR